MFEMSSSATEAEGGTVNDNPNPEANNTLYGCTICLDTASNAVVSYCGHLFCWPCLRNWFETQPNRHTCPVCKAGISKDKVIPIYGQGNADNKDPREKFPPRPAGQKAELNTQEAFPGIVEDGGFHMSFGIGAFPFSIFASTFNFSDGRPGPPQAGSLQQHEEQVLSKHFLYVAVAFFILLLLA